MSSIRPFHLAIPVSDLVQARLFYAEKLGCREGRSSSHWVDFDFFRSPTGVPPGWWRAGQRSLA